jgi:hypothetical protein
VSGVLNKRVLWLAACASALLALLMSWHTWTRLVQEGKILERKRSDLIQLQNIEHQVRLGDMAQQKLEDGKFVRPVSFAEAVRDLPASLKIGESREERIALRDGWTAVRKEIVFQDAAVSNALALARKMESLQPPWSAAGVTLRSSGKTPGVGQVTLVMEALEKQ